MIKSLLFLPLFIASVAYSQGGLFGETKGFDINLNIVPTLSKTHTYDHDVGRLVLEPKIVHLNYAVNFFKYVKRNGELSFGVNYTHLRLHSEGQQIIGLLREGKATGVAGSPKPYSNSFILLEDLRANNFGVEFKRKYYLSGIAPLGFYIGWTLGTSLGFLNQKEFVVGNAHYNGHSTEFYNLANVRTFEYTNPESIIFGHTAVVIGRSFLLSNRLALNIGARLPIFGYGADSNGEKGYIFSFTEERRSIDIEEQYWGELLSYSIVKANQFGVDFALKWHF